MSAYDPKRTSASDFAVTHNTALAQRYARVVFRPEDEVHRLGSCPAQSAKNEPFIGDFRLYFRGPKTSRNTTLRSSSARAQSPVKLEPCMMASVLGFRSASFFKFPAVSGV
jgi:hypothetical protein